MVTRDFLWVKNTIFLSLLIDNTYNKIQNDFGNTESFTFRSLYMTYHVYKMYFWYNSIASDLINTLKISSQH